MAPLGFIPDPVYGSTRTSISPSPIGQTIVPNQKAPARLSPFKDDDGNLIEPMKMATKKVDITPAPIDLVILEACRQDLLALLQTNKNKERSYKPLSMEEAIKGVEGDPYMPGISRKSSPGYPWIHKRKYGAGKQQWLGTNEEWKLDDKEFVSLFALRMEEASKGRRLPTLWVDTLKDELRPISRVKAGKTRLFSVGEMTFNVAVRKFFLPVVAHLMENRIDFETCVGANPYSTDWERIARRLRSKGRHVIAGDFSNFDGSLIGPFLWAVCHILIDLCDATDTEKLQMFVLFSDIAHSVHVQKAFVYAWGQSQPSGNPLTVIINSLINSLAIRYCWMLLTKGTKFYGMAQFWLYVALVTYGDDFVVNISSEVLDLFNMVTLMAAMAVIGFALTDEHKSDDCAVSRSLNEVDFLKRRFVFDRSTFRWKAPLSLDTVLEMAQWSRGKEDPHLVCGQTLEIASYELAQHTRATFDEWMPHLRGASLLLNSNARPKFETYDIYQQMDCEKYFRIPVLVC